MKINLRNGSFVAALLLGSSAFAQTVPEVEPNSTKATATPVLGIAAGGVITGTSTGTGVGVADTTNLSVDTYRVKTGALAPNIYLHSLTLTSATAGNAGTIRGLTQTGGAPTGTDAIAQTNVSAVNKWYGFGAQEEIYYQVSGTAGSTAPYGATLTTTPVVPIAIAGTFNPGTIVITTAGQGHTTDTELYLYDSTGTQVAGGHNDDNTTAGGLQSRLSLPLAAGTYFLGVGTFNTCNNLGDANPGENYLTGVLLDFPNALLRNETYTTALPVNFSVSDGITTTPVAATLPAPLEVVWGTFTVQVNTNPPANDNCANATAIGSGTFSGSVAFATNDGAASCDPGGGASRDVWYSFTDTLGGGTLNLDTCGSTADTVLSVYTACGGTELACNDNCGGAPCAANSSCVTVILNPSQTVKIRISDKGLSGGFYTLHSSLTLGNDSCTTAVTLPGPGVYPFDTTLATTGEGTTSACSTQPAKDLWYSYAATTNGTLTVDTCNQVTGATSTDTEIWIYQGGGCPVSPAIACNDDACGTTGLHSSVSTPVTCGVIYMLEVGNYNGQTTANMSGTFTVTETGTACATASTPFCLGDGTGVPCPCSPTPNNGAPGHGCGSQMFPGGAILTNSGIASDETGVGTMDTLSLIATNVPGPALFIQSNGLIGAIPFGDGQLCAAIGIIRLGVVFPTANVASYPGGLTPNEIHLQGLASAGQTKHYQAWYRSVPGVCTAGQNYDLTQGLTLTWVP